MSKHHHRNHNKGSNHNEGEGSRSADRAYTEGVQSFIREDKVQPAARDAKKFVEEHPTEAERDEMAGKAGPRPIVRRVEELVTEGKAMFDRAVSRVRSVIHRRAARR
jgi:hypothetical protein